MAEKLKVFGGEALGSVFQAKNKLAPLDNISVINLPIDKIRPGKNQPRRYFDNESLEELAQSIKSEGIIQPIIVSNSNDGFYEIIVGERRWRATQIAGQTNIPSAEAPVSKNS